MIKDAPPPDAALPELMYRSEAATYLKVLPRFLYELGTYIPFVKLGGRYVYWKADLDAFMEKHMVQTTTYIYFSAEEKTAMNEMARLLPPPSMLQ